jgi:hypothetical protein
MLKCLKCFWIWVPFSTNQSLDPRSIPTKPITNHQSKAASPLRSRTHFRVRFWALRARTILHLSAKFSFRLSALSLWFLSDLYPGRVKYTRLASKEKPTKPNQTKPNTQNDDDTLDTLVFIESQHDDELQRLALKKSPPNQTKPIKELFTICFTICHDMFHDMFVH